MFARRTHTKKEASPQLPPLRNGVHTTALVRNRRRNRNRSRKAPSEERHLLCDGMRGWVTLRSPRLVVSRLSAGMGSCVCVQRRPSRLNTEGTLKKNTSHFKEEGTCTYCCSGGFPSNLRIWVFVCRVVSLLNISRWKSQIIMIYFLCYENPESSCPTKEIGYFKG